MTPQELKRQSEQIGGMSDYITLPFGVYVVTHTGDLWQGQDYESEPQAIVLIIKVSPLHGHYATYIYCAGIDVARISQQPHVYNVSLVEVGGYQDSYDGKRLIVDGLGGPFRLLVPETMLAEINAGRAVWN